MIINAVVKTSKKEFKITRNGTWTISVKSRPHGNEANREIVRELSRDYSAVRILKGLKSRRKVIELTL